MQQQQPMGAVKLTFEEVTPTIIGVYRNGRQVGRIQPYPNHETFAVINKRNKVLIRRETLSEAKAFARQMWENKR